MVQSVPLVFSTKPCKNYSVQTLFSNYLVIYDVQRLSKIRVIVGFYLYDFELIDTFKSQKLVWYQWSRW